MIDYAAQISAFLGPAVLAAAKADARARYPQESCGFVASGQYISCENLAEKPEQDFKINDQRFDNALIGGKLTAVIHSHPGGPIFPTGNDMQQQVATGVPWFIISLNDTAIGHVVGWGDALPRAPVIGRPFVHGVFDCYSIIRDVYGLGRDALKEQGVEWPFPPIKLPEYPRDDNWWQAGGDLYSTNFAKAGFKPISITQVQPGDIFLIALGTPQTNPKKRLCHGGLLLTKNMLLHHLPGRDSRREPAGLWARAADLWIRHTP